MAIVGIVGWGYLVKVWAEREAREEAEKCAKKIAHEYLESWLANEAPQIIRQHVDYIRDASLGTDDDEEAADKIGKEAG